MFSKNRAKRRCLFLPTTLFFCLFRAHSHGSVSSSTSARTHEVVERQQRKKRKGRLLSKRQFLRNNLVINVSCVALPLCVISCGFVETVDVNGRLNGIRVRTKKEQASPKLFKLTRSIKWTLDCRSITNEGRWRSSGDEGKSQTSKKTAEERCDVFRRSVDPFFQRRWLPLKSRQRR